MFTWPGVVMSESSFGSRFFRRPPQVPSYYLLSYTIAEVKAKTQEISPQSGGAA